MTNAYVPVDGSFDILEDWIQYRDAVQPNILERHGLCIAKDGGVSDIDDLMYPTQYYYASVIFVSCFVNAGYVIWQDLRPIMGVDTGDESIEVARQKFLLSKTILATCFNLDEEAWNLDAVVPGLELLIVMYLLCRILLSVSVALFAERLSWLYKDRWELERWLTVSRLFWEEVQQLSSFSAMRLLYYVTPSVVGTQGYMVFAMMGHHIQRATSIGEVCEATWPAVRYICKNVCCTVIGIDAFLIKCRLAGDKINQTHFKVSYAVQTAVFLYQVLGIVNLNWFSRERLFIFVFGGEDGTVEPEEMERWNLWSALVAKHIYGKFGLIRGTVVMMAFDDYDLQSLVLDDEGKQTKIDTRATQAGTESANLAVWSHGDEGAISDGEHGHPTTPVGASFLRDGVLRYISHRPAVEAHGHLVGKNLFRETRSRSRVDEET